MIYWLWLGLVSTGPSWAKAPPATGVAAAENPALAGATWATGPLRTAQPKASERPDPARLTTPAGSAVGGAKTKNGGQVLVVVRGNSQAYGALTTGNVSPIGSQSTGAWPDEAAALLGSGYVWQNRSHDGATIDYLRLSDATEVAPLFHTGNYGEEWIVLQETTNQIFQANPAQQVYSKMAAWAQYWRSQGVKVAVVTCYPTQDAQYNAEIDAINDLYRANWSSFCDMLLDAKSSPYLTQLGMDPKYGYSPDGLHLTDAGNQIPAHCAADGFSGSRNGIIPATFVLPGIAVPGGVAAKTPTAPASTTPTPTPTTPTTPATPTPVPAGTSLRVQYGTSTSDYVTNGSGDIQQRLDQSGQGRVATVTPGQDGPLLSSDNGRQVALFDPGRKGWTQSLTTVGALAANADASIVVDLGLLYKGANSVLSVGPDFSIWFQNSTKLQVFDKSGNYTTPVDLDKKGLTRLIFTFEASTRQMVVYANNAEAYRVTLTALPWVGDNPVLDLEQGSYAGGKNALSGEMGALAVYSGLLGTTERTAWFADAPAATTTPTTTPVTTTPTPISTANLRVQYGTGTGDYVTNGSGDIQQRLDQSGQGRVATVTPGQDGPLLSSDNGRQVALFDPGRKGWTQSLTTVGALAANADASIVVDLGLLYKGANSVLSVGPDFSIWFQNSTKLQVFDKSGNYATPVDLDKKGLTRLIFTFEASTRQMVVYANNAEAYRVTLTALPWVGDNPVLDLEQGSYAGGKNALSGEMGALAVYSGLLGTTERTAWFADAPAAAANSASLTAFTATASASSAAVALAWSAAPQTSNAQYQVERSSDGSTFRGVGPATGTTAAAKSFGLTDSQLPTAATTLYYRVRKTDASGVASYSAVRTVELAPAAASLVLYPNPAHTTTRLQNATPNTKVQLLDGLGRVVATATTDATGSVELALPAGLAGGVYIVRQGSRFSRLVVE
ncbi:hypothetical protein A0257_02385 [Hymenobacter psoromatis]|nr:hypothetical protein A0257_02385 [Hymenobacter psoromatis]